MTMVAPSASETVVSGRISPLDAIGTTAERGDTSLMALRRGQLDFDVTTVPMRNPVTNQVIPGFYATMREDTKEVLGIVEGRYRVFQNRDVFDIADRMVQEDGAIITRTSCLGGGSRCFLNVEWPRDRSISVVGDIVARRALIQNSHDGKFSAVVRLIPFRLACANGMMIPVPCFTFEFRIKHTESGDERLVEARKIMAGASRYFETFGEVAKHMASTRVSSAFAETILKSIPDLSKKTTACDNKRKAILSLFNGGQANASHEAIKGTAWGLLNAIAEYVDHKGRIRQTIGNDIPTQRFKNVLEGAGASLKLAAFQTMVKTPDLGLRDFNERLAASRRN